MRTPRTRVCFRRVVPLVLCAALGVGCSTVGGTAARGGATPPSSISVVAPGTEDDTDPADTASTTAPSPPTSATPAPPSSIEVPAPTTPDSSPGPSSGPAGGTPGPSVTAGDDPDVSSLPELTTATGTQLGLAQFQSPSRNINCLITEGLSVRCDLGVSDIAEQHDCEDGGDWGQAIALDRGRKAEMLCASDTVTDPDAPILAYGSSARIGSITCTSAQDGITCADDLGHGFRMSRASYEVR